MEITRALATKVRDTVAAGLVSGLGIQEPGKMCVEAAVCYALGLPHGDDPGCVSKAVRALKIRLNDSSWSSPMSRAKGLRRLALVQLGSSGIVDDREFAKRVAEMSIRKMVPIALRAAASIQKDAKHRQALTDAANKCEAEGTRASAQEARAAAAAAAANAVAAAANAVAAAANAVAAAANAVAAAAAAANAVAAAAAANAVADAAAANAVADAKAQKRDEILSEFAEAVVQILIEMDAPGCQWLDLVMAA